MNSIKASTLAEILVVLILTGIILLSVMDGYALFGRLIREATGMMEGYMDKREYLLRFARMFSASDSIVFNAEAQEFKFYNSGKIVSKTSIEDSLMIVRRGNSCDTVLSRIKSTRIVAHDHTGYIVDSLIVVNDTIEMAFGHSYNPAIRAVYAAEELEKTHANED